MQPYFFPYIGYFQLIHEVDIFVVYDNIEYTKKGWINRNRIQQNGQEKTFSIPIKKDSDYLQISERLISPEFNRKNLLNQIRGAYGKAPYFKEIFPLLQEIILFSESNLFPYIYNSIVLLAEFLEIETKIRISSQIEMDHSLKGENRVIATCKALNADVYVNSAGGVDLYKPAHFQKEGVDLKFLKSELLTYEQFSQNFIPSLSIIDVLMFNGKKKLIDTLIEQYTQFGT
ncbi:MAG: WbqC family protein [Leptospirales bacterium]